MKIKNNMIYVIAEIGVNHNGSVKTAMKLIREAKICGANAVKFQKFIPELMILEKTKKASYQRKLSNSNESQFEMLKKYQLKDKDYLDLHGYCRKKRIDFICTPFELVSLNFLLKKLKLPMIKISSTDLTNVPMLIEVGRRNCKVILSTGMSTLPEIDIALSALAFGNLKLKNKFSLLQQSKYLNRGKNYLKNKVTLMHCTSAYPAPPNELNLNAIDVLKKRYKTSIGYSDHSNSLITPSIVAAKNISCVEVHVTLNNKLNGPDHASSLNILKFKKYVDLIRQTETMMGRHQKYITKSEFNTKKFAQKSLVISSNIMKNDKISQENLSIKRPGTGISPIHYFDFIGKKVKINLKKNTLMSKKFLK